jgi:hypothetical protein
VGIALHHLRPSPAPQGLQDIHRRAGHDMPTGPGVAQSMERDAGFTSSPP